MPQKKVQKLVAKQAKTMARQLNSPGTKVSVINVRGRRAFNKPRGGYVKRNIRFLRPQQNRNVVRRPVPRFNRKGPPVAYSGPRLKPNKSHVRSGKNGTVLHAKGKCFVGAVNVNAATYQAGQIVFSHLLSPQTMALNNLNGYAAMFQNYKFKRAAFTFSPNLPTNTPGMYLHVVIKDPTDTVPTGEQGVSFMVANYNEKSRPIYEFSRTALNPKDNPVKEYWTSQNNSDYRLTTEGTYLFMIGAQTTFTAGTIGNIELDYEVEFYNPTQNPVVGTNYWVALGGVNSSSSTPLSSTSTGYSIDPDSDFSPGIGVSSIGNQTIDLGSTIFNNQTATAIFNQPTCNTILGDVYTVLAICTGTGISNTPQLLANAGCTKLTAGSLESTGVFTTGGAISVADFQVTNAVVCQIGFTCSSTTISACRLMIIKKGNALQTGPPTLKTLEEKYEQQEQEIQLLKDQLKLLLLADQDHDFEVVKEVARAPQHATTRAALATPPRIRSGTTTPQG